ncbi:hypothetical protein HN873_036036 [Arachis hypogaea]
MPPQPPPSRFLTPFYSSRLPCSDERRLSILCRCLPHRKGKGKATGKRKRGDSSQSIISLMHDSSWREKNFTQQEKADQLLPANDSIKFANQYCELMYTPFANSRNLYLERTLRIPEALQQYTTEPTKQRGWFFLERTLTEVNAS